MEMKKIIVIRKNDLIKTRDNEADSLKSKIQIEK